MVIQARTYETLRRSIKRQIFENKLLKTPWPVHNVYLFINIYMKYFRHKMVLKTALISDLCSILDLLSQKVYGMVAIIRKLWQLKLFSDVIFL